MLRDSENVKVWLKGGKIAGHVMKFLADAADPSRFPAASRLVWGMNSLNVIGDLRGHCRLGKFV
jgi:hypothetical protein